MGLPLAGATVLLSGAYAGIGAAAAPVFAERGATVVVTGWRRERLDALVATLPGDGHAAVAPTSQRQERRRRWSSPRLAMAIADAIEGDAFEVYSPDLRSVVEWKTSNADAYLAGVAEMARGAP